ncbi:uncharacterized protein LOC111033854 [Myzus persicae]|uniref:uncharacterized protein LOC111033854 n=1 Tax=Myzus persicae TaxID=13164 RepID=UPI000B9367DC|nr:uncharacterized protein LOC111033854 [Myzus persicae]
MGNEQMSYLLVIAVESDVSGKKFNAIGNSWKNRGTPVCRSTQFENHCSIPPPSRALHGTNSLICSLMIPRPTEKYDIIGIKWIRSILNSYPNFSLVNIYRQYVCSKHFKDQHFILPDKLLLKSFAIPTVFDSGHRIRVGGRQINNTAAGMNTVRGISTLVNNNVYTNNNNVQVISVSNSSYNTIEMRTMTRNIFNCSPSIEHTELQEPSEQTAMASSRSLQTRKRRFEYEVTVKQ